MPTEPQAATPRPQGEANTARVDPLEAYNTVQRAVAAQREKDARIAENFAEMARGRSQDCYDIAAAIRRGE
jgi:hypothetical protein